MLGLFGNKRQRVMKRAERAMVIMGRAASVNDLRLLYAAIQAQTKALGELHLMDVSENEFDNFIASRGNVTWLNDETFRHRLEELAWEAEKVFGRW